MTQLGTKKSRKGCTNCKRRRVKCNEQAPCANCSRRGEQCSLLGAPTPGTELGPETSGLSPEEWIQDLELMHHYDRDTLLQPLGIREDCQHLWRENIPREAIKHSFLMHGILALSALHIVHTRPAEADKYLRLCDKHQTKALEMFRTVLCTDITPGISTALFALSSTISILSMGRSCADAMSMPEPRYVSMEQVAELFLLTRGVRDLIHTCMEWVSAGPLGPMLDGHYSSDAHDVQLPVAVQKQFINLQYMLDECCAIEYRPECERALRRLEDIYRSVLSASTTMGEVETSQIWRWMLLAPCEFVTMIRACFPPALILLAHFAAVSLTVRKAWYTSDWGHYVLTGISMVLYGSDMYSYLEWPMEQARSHMMILTQPEEIDSVMNGSPPTASRFPFDQTLSLEPGFDEAELGFVAF